MGEVVAFPFGGRASAPPRPSKPTPADDERPFFMNEANWRRSKKGNLYLNVYGCNVVVFRRDGGFGWRVENRRGGIVWCERISQTMGEAMADAWSRK
jgi:hypothetical protein